MSYQPQFNSYISTNNSSTSTLTNGSTFTGTWEDVSKYESIIVAVKTDQDGVFYIDFSPDGTNADSTLTRYYNTPDIEAPHRFTITRQYFRVRFTNDSGSAQTSFRLQTSVKAQSTELNAPIDSTLARDFDSIVVRPTDYATEVATGIRQGAVTWNKFGYNTAVGGTNEVIAEFGPASPNIMTSADTLDVVSSSANDTSAGTGVRTILITGIDENSELQTETVTMNGTTPVTTTNSWLGVNRVVSLTAGSGGVAAGTITIDDNGGTVGTQATIPAGGNVTQQCIFHTEANSTFLMTFLYFDVLKGGGSPIAKFTLFSYSRATGLVYEAGRFTVDTSVETSKTIPFQDPLVFGAREIIYLSGNSSPSAEIQGRFSGKLIKSASAE